MAKKHTYELTVDWTGNLGSGTSAYDAYSRDHLVRVGSKAAIEASSDPALKTMERRLATAWLAQGNARMAEGKHDAAGKAFANARSLTPDLPGLAEAEAHLQKP